MSSEAVTREEGPDPMIGKVLDERYRIEEALGQGGIGRVYKARHLILGRWVALKVLLAQHEAVPVLQERFRREAEALAALSHPNIVTVTDFGVAEGMPYLVMELLEGQDLASLIEAEEIEPKRALGIVRQVLRALAYAHSRDLVHRDLKPHNVFVRALGDGTDHVEVLDFGLARFVGDAANRGPKLTRAGALLGTPAYMAPEQVSGEAVDARADVYAAGIVLFETLTGRKPFETKDPGEMLRAHLLSPPPRIAQADPGLEVAEALEQLAARALAKSPAERFATAAEMLSALDALGPEPVKRIAPRPPRDRALRASEATHLAPTRAATPDAVAQARGARVSEASVNLPKSRFPLLAGLGCAAGIAVGAGVALAWAVSSGALSGADEAVDVATTPDPAPEPAPSDVEDTDVLQAPTRPPAVNPFAGPLPNELRRLHQRVERGRELTRQEYGALSRYNGAHPEDVRGRLILAHGYMNARSLSYALPIYEDVLRDPTHRGDPRILPELLEIVRANDRSLNQPAARLVTSVYGEEALPAIEAELAGGRVRRDERQRLEALRARIGSAAAAGAQP